MPKDADKFDWKASNLANFGTDSEKQVKKESAETELAWKDSGSKPGLEIWRINQFKVEKWPVEDYGKFYSGDSYIIMNTYKDGEELKYDIHFWIGKYSTADEYGTAAYKTVELDTYHDDKPIQHREVQGHESVKFKEYFDFYTVMKGGCDSGFRRVGPQAYKPRLFQVVGIKKQIDIIDIPFKRGNLNSEDVFILDLGLRIYQFNGETATKDEKFKATQYVNNMRSDRQGKPRLDILEERSISPGHRFYKSIPDGKSTEKGEDGPPVNEIAIYRISDVSGITDFEMVLNGSLDRNQLDSKDVFVINTGVDVYCWVGKGASIDERRNAMGYTHKYLMKQENAFAPITIVSEGQKCDEFEAIW